LQASFLADTGIGQYGSAQLPDVAVDPNGLLATITEFQAMSSSPQRRTREAIAR
jgi:hypothetical protein